jgi:D-alanine-D-alanine ligase
MTSVKRLKVAVLFGGRSVEHEVSVRSARAVIAALEACGHEAIPVGVTHAGGWRTGLPAARMLGNEDGAGGEWAADFLVVPDPQIAGLAAPGGPGKWVRLPVDVAFPVIHGSGGEDGTLQGVLELAEIPYVGSGVGASALGMDKRLQRRLFRAAGLPVVPTVEVRRSEWEAHPDQVERRILGAVGLPCFVKPAASGSSVGVVKVKGESALPAALAEACRYDAWVLAEPALAVRELESAVLGNEDAAATAPGEIVPGREFYDYRAKYLEDTSRLLLPAPVSPECAAEVRKMAVEAFQCLGCSGLARVDFFLENGTGKLYVNEINTLPGFTSISMYPRLWAAEGWPPARLVQRLLDLALAAHADRRRNERVLPGDGR